MLELNRVTKYQQYQQELVQSHFVGLSSEDKPTEGADGEDLVAGCVFEELDTGDRYWWDGLAWRVVEASDAETLLETIDGRLQTQNALLAHMIEILAIGLNVNV